MHSRSCFGPPFDNQYIKTNSVSFFNSLSCEFDSFTFKLLN